MNVFDGLGDLGFGDISNVDIFALSQGQGREQKAEERKAVFRPEDYLFTRTCECAVCGKDFEETAVRKSKLRYVSSDTDLRPRYEPVDPLYYDVLMCPHCGYAAMTSSFKKVTDKQAEFIRKQITPKFKAKKYPFVMTVDMVIERYKFALLNAVTKHVEIGERSFLCLKLAWLYRDKGDIKNELLFTENAYRGFREAFSRESFPICSMDEPTLTYLIGELARRAGDYSEALKWVGKVVVQRNINQRLKNRAMEVKELIQDDAKKRRESGLPPGENAAGQNKT